MKHKPEERSIIEFKDGNLEIDVRVDSEKDTVWLTQKQMSVLFDVSIDNISLHINNIYKENELDMSSTTEESSEVRLEGKRSVTRKIKVYNLDVIISTGYRVKSKRGISSNLINSNTNIPWSEMYGFRNRIVHDYDQVDMTLFTIP